MARIHRLQHVDGFAAAVSPTMMRSGRNTQGVFSANHAW